jgi:hypothetical protein
MSSDVTNKTPVQVNIVNKEYHINGFHVQAKAKDKLKIVYNGLEYEVFDIEGHLMMNRVYR